MKKSRKQIMDDIMKLIAIKSFTHNEEGIRNCQNLLMEMADDMGFYSYLRANDRVLVIEPQNVKGTPVLGMVMHIDTVPFDKNEWQHNPLGELTESKIYGRGVVDDKGPIILAMHALKELEDILNGLYWQIIIGSSEEGEWVDMREFLEENPILPKFLVTIDGDGVSNGCRGYMDLSLKFKRETKTNVLRDFYVPNGMNNTVPAKAIAVMFGKEIVCRGKEVHSSIPEQGKSALSKIAEYIRKQESEVYSEFSNMFDFLARTNKAYDESVFGLPVLTDDFGIGTSVSATNATMTGDEIKININVRIGPKKTREDVETILEFVESYGAEIEVFDFVMPSYVDSEQREFVAMVDSYKEVVGTTPTVCIARGLGYNAALPNCAIFGPRLDEKDDDEVDTCHQADECRSFDNIFKFYDILKTFLIKIR